LALWWRSREAPRLRSRGESNDRWLTGTRPGLLGERLLAFESRRGLGGVKDLSDLRGEVREPECLRLGLGGVRERVFLAGGDPDRL